MVGHRGELIALSARAGLPIMYKWRQFVEDGGLVSYGADRAEIDRN